VRLADLRRQLHVLRTGAANVDVLKREVAALGRGLLVERTKVKALAEELENPLNVHRCVWGGWAGWWVGGWVGWWWWWGAHWRGEMWMVLDECMCCSQSPHRKTHTPHTSLPP